MPTVLRIGPYRFFFHSNEGNEPPHIHVQRDRALAKFWLETGNLSKSKHFAAHELTDIARLIAEKRTSLLEAWHEHYDG